MQRESQGKYVFVVIRDHPMADSRGRLLEHRYVMAEHLGRTLRQDEVVHHKDGDIRNNSLANLELMLCGEHSKHHRPANIVELTCPNCNVAFERAKRAVRTNLVFCSRSCSTSYYALTVGRKGSRLQHGTYSAYRNGGCHCVECRKANAVRTANYRERKKKRDMA